MWSWPILKVCPLSKPLQATIFDLYDHSVSAGVKVIIMLVLRLCGPLRNINQCAHNLYINTQL